MSDITLSAGVRTNLQSLQGIASLLATTQNRLATGKKVNSALDNPTNFFVAQNLSDRAGGLTKLLDGVNNGISTLQTASKGLDSIYKAIQSAAGIVDSLKADVAKASNQVTGTVNTLSASTTLTSLGFANNDRISFTDSVSGAVTQVNLGAIGAQTVQDLVNKINAQGNGAYSAALSGPPGGAKLILTSTASTAFTVSGTTGAAITASIGSGGTLTSTVGTVDQTAINSYAKQFNELLTSIDQLAADSSFNGVNLLKAGNDLKVDYNEDGSTSTTLTSQAVTSANFNLTNVSTTGTATVSDFTGQVQSLKDALSQVRLIQSDYSTKLSVMQNRQDFSKSVVNLLKTGSDNLTLADQNEEAANVLALQTRQSLSQSALSLAVQSDQSVLQLLK